ncbi:MULTISPECIES: PQQ-dependent sugar dehydrogenase [unclassified Arcicella]|uniref:PQQ-dependent sugar dehydrogenase n=1 Tax=unclassified Arcicella TaxID=2644986 RepID=UPI00285E29FF|nr:MULTISPECIES: PQQ-dependent sugar dehydrogenase [unclassified Arcicella]MDR6561549.1 glucose/arabinose dehydrogenase [Arcicella sp. BE51]MDR6811433.1 glucose/arabinose dehydrogenase [Arcicella sp. BE140]MDR6822783.1 glucose/arabinose dehydrogenase [Arcicella sp. BE139]
MITIKKLSNIFFLSLVFSCSGYSQEAISTIKVDTKLISDQLSHPTVFAEPNDKSGRLFVGEQEGKIKIIQKGKVLPTLFLDITDEVVKKKGYEERGLLGLAFHPDFAKNGKLYVYCSIPVANGTKGVDHKSLIREYTVSSKDKNTVDESTAKTVLEFNEPQSNHNGGDLKFGPDGFLYIAVGDGGGQNDKHGEFGNAQNLSNFLGKILRVDVKQLPYSIPSDNPFVGKSEVRPEIFAYGFRNPWRISFDKKTGELFVGDVGQDNYEEVDLVTKGGNYGWRIREGLHEKFPNDPDPKNWINPISEYPHSDGLSITGGFVYRGKQIPALYGKYIFADWTGPVWALTDSKKEQWNREKLSISQEAGNWHIYSFGEDQAGEVYLLTVLLGSDKGALYQLVTKK